MNNNLENISLYFDTDFINLIYKDLEINKNKELEKILVSPQATLKNNSLNERENKNEISIFNLKTFKVGSVGFTSKELEEEKINFGETKIITNDYNGPSPSYDIVCAKILFNKDDEKILGMQIANSKNIETRLDCIKKMMEEGKTLEDLGRHKVYETKDNTEIDVISMAAIMGSQENKGIEDLKQIKAEEIEKILKEENSYILDVREDDEYRAGHIKGAVNIPLRSLVPEIKNLPKNKNIYIYCRTAHRSLDAVTFLVSMGMKNVYNVRGGIIELSYNEFYKDKGNLENSILTNYTFE